MLTQCFGCLATALGAASHQLCLMTVSGHHHVPAPQPGLQCQRQSTLRAEVLWRCSSATSITSNPSALLWPCFFSLYFQTDEAGCFSTNVNLSSFSRDFRYYRDSIVVEASLVEDSTGNSGISGAWKEAREGVLIWPKVQETFRLARDLSLPSPLGLAI